MVERAKAPGLKYRRRKMGPEVPYWVADDEARKVGYPVKAVNLSLFANETAELVRRCERLQAEMRLWLTGARSATPTFDGTFGSLIERYLCDRESSYARLKPSSRHPYDIYASKLKAHIGERRIDHCDGRDVRKWFKVWAGGVEDLRDPAARIPAARMGLTVLKSAVSFGVICRLPGCQAFNAILAELEFPTNRRRPYAPKAADIEAARRAAHAAGAPSRALAYALQFETTLRQWDVIGQWVPLSDPRPSAIIAYGEKWIGPTWAQIDDDFVLRLTHQKTAETSGAVGSYDLRLCPMVVAELNQATSGRAGPLIVDERTQLPYRYKHFQSGWKADFKKAGINHKVWNRDLRAGGVTEGGIAGATIEDRSKVAGHTNPRMTAQIYDRDRLEAHRRVAKTRAGFRDRNGEGT